MLFRSGAGPFPTEASELKSYLVDDFNVTNPWQEEMRFGYFDMVLAKYAVEVSGKIDKLAVHHLDHIQGRTLPVCTSYITPEGRELFELPGSPGELQTELLSKVRPEFITPDLDGKAFARFVATTLGIPLGMVGFGPKTEDKEFISKPAPEN